MTSRLDPSDVTEQMSRAEQDMRTHQRAADGLSAAVSWLNPLENALSDAHWRASRIPKENKTRLAYIWWITLLLPVAYYGLLLTLELLFSVSTHLDAPHPLTRWIFAVGAGVLVYAQAMRLEKIPSLPFGSGARKATAAAAIEQAKTDLCVAISELEGTTPHGFLPRYARYINDPWDAPMQCLVDPLQYIATQATPTDIAPHPGCTSYVHLVARARNGARKAAEDAAAEYVGFRADRLTELQHTKGMCA